MLVEIILCIKIGLHHSSIFFEIYRLFKTSRHFNQFLTTDVSFIYTISIITFLFRTALADSFYSSGMCFGRLMSIWLATVILPSSLLIICMISCLLGTILLIFLAPLYHTSLYVGVAIMGFFVSWQFGTGFSWTSQYMNITGKLSSIFFIGCTFYNISL